MKIGEIIKKLRLEHNITQEKLADHLGISFQAVSKWENGTALPDITLVAPIALYFGVTTDEILNFSPLKNQQAMERLWHAKRNLKIAEEKCEEYEANNKDEFMEVIRCHEYTILCEKIGMAMQELSDARREFALTKLNSSVNIDDVSFGFMTAEQRKERQERFNENFKDIDGLPWEDDDEIRTATFLGKKIAHTVTEFKRFTMIYEGQAVDLNIQLATPNSSPVMRDVRDDEPSGVGLGNYVGDWLLIRPHDADNGFFAGYKENLEQHRKYKEGEQ